MTEWCDVLVRVWCLLHKWAKPRRESDSAVLTEAAIFLSDRFWPFRHNRPDVIYEVPLLLYLFLSFEKYLNYQNTANTDVVAFINVSHLYKTTLPFLASLVSIFSSICHYHFSPGRHIKLKKPYYSSIFHQEEQLSQCP